MAPGTVVQIREGWSRVYRKPRSTLTGVVTSMSPSGKVARVRMDALADSYILVDHLELASLASQRAA